MRADRPVYIYNFERVLRLKLWSFSNKISKFYSNFHSLMFVCLFCVHKIYRLLCHKISSLKYPLKFFFESVEFNASIPYHTKTTIYDQSDNVYAAMRPCQGKFSNNFCVKSFKITVTHTTYIIIGISMLLLLRRRYDIHVLLWKNEMNCEL